MDVEKANISKNKIVYFFIYGINIVFLLSNFSVVKAIITVLLAFCIFYQPISGQKPVNTISQANSGEASFNDDSMLVKQTRYIQELHHQFMNVSNEILNGKEYGFYFFPSISSPLMPSKQMPTASIVIHGNKYENIMLQYDTFKDLAVYFDPKNLINNSICPISINKYIIDEFNLKVEAEDLKFKYFEFPNDPKAKKRNGFYEVIYDGHSKYLIHHKSDLIVEGGRDIYKYRPVKYAINEGILYKFKGKRSLLKAFNDKSMELKKYIKTSKIKVRKARKKQIGSILEYYDSLLMP